MSGLKDNTQRECYEYAPEITNPIEADFDTPVLVHVLYLSICVS